MFEIGTKIRLVASSCRKSTGPKRGSVGYVSNVMNKVVYMEHNIATCCMEVYFFRYGFEKRTRLEKQVVINTFPIADSTKGDVRPQIDKIVRKINGRNGDDWSHALKSFYNLPPTAVLTVAIPVMANPLCLMDCSEDEFRAYTAALFGSSDYSMFINTGMMTKHHRNAQNQLLSNTSSWETLRNMSMDRSFRLDRTNSWLKAERSRAAAIQILRMTTTMMGAKDHKRKVSEALARLINMDPRKEIPLQPVYDALQDVLLNKPVIDNLKEQAKNNNAPFLLALLEDVETTKATLLVLSARLEKEHA